ncbi:Pentatricopeptide repeat-containing protein, chloroplastic [Glycine soja]|uniref:Pentatricopeptide repeat-containing protein, chloroplastic n=1 Tax=Glycine soja TaxID=3848 RepID=A0A445KZU7_GLYSO|nr:Pentatricopeptide repeat-containing protein, chloroplastic [Glycine soja]
MQEAGQKSDSITLVSVLPAVADVKALRIGRSIHNYAFSVGFESMANVATAMLDMYFKCGSVRNARFMFKGMSSCSRNVVSWNTMINGYEQNGESEEAFATFLKMLDEGVEPTNETTVTWIAMILGYAHNGCVNEALNLFCEMQSHDIKPDSFTLVSVIIALADLSVTRQARWIHGLAIRTLMDKNVFVCAALIDTYAKCGAIQTARKLFGMMQE